MNILYKFLRSVRLIPKGKIFNTNIYYIWQYFVVYVVLTIIVSIIISFTIELNKKTLRYNKIIRYFPNSVVKDMIKIHWNIIFITLSIGIGGTLQFVNPNVIQFYYHDALYVGAFIFCMLGIMNLILYPYYTSQLQYRNLYNIRKKGIKENIHMHNQLIWYINSRKLNCMHFQLYIFRIYIINLINLYFETEILIIIPINYKLQSIFVNIDNFIIHILRNIWHKF